MSLNVPDVFMLLAAVIILGWMGQAVFERTRVPDVLLLLGFGYLLGPVLQVADPDALRQFSSLFGALALIIILFDGGLKLRLRDLLSQWGPALALTLATFLLTALAVGWAGHQWFGLAWPQALLLGAIVAGAPSGVVAIPVVNKMRVTAATRTVVSLEASLSDVFAIVTVVLGISVLGFHHGGGGPGAVVAALLDAFLVSAVLALAIGLSWLWVLNTARGNSLTYMLTLAVLFLAYAAAEMVGASGALTVLLTGAVVANAQEAFAGLGRGLRKRALKLGVPARSDAYRLLDVGQRFKAPDDSLLRFNHEVSFFVRTFFFVFLGVVAQVPDGWAETWPALLAFLLAMAARALAVASFTAFFPLHRPAFATYLVMVPRGLAAAALAYLPASQGVPGAEGFASLAFAFILLSNLLLTLGVPLIERRGADPPRLRRA